MENFNFSILFVAAFIPLVVKLVWYNVKFLGNSWIKESGVNFEDLNKGNKLKILGLTYLFSLFIAAALLPIVVHPIGFFAMFQHLKEVNNHDINSELYLSLKKLYDTHGFHFRTFKHGMLHGILTGFLLAMPLLGINALLERKSFKYLCLHAGFWILCLMLMGGIISQWL